MGQAESSTQLTIEDIRNHLSEEDKLLLLTNNKAPKFIEGLKSCQATVNEEFKFTVQGVYTWWELPRVLVQKTAPCVPRPTTRK